MQRAEEQKSKNKIMFMSECNKQPSYRILLFVGCNNFKHYCHYLRKLLEALSGITVIVVQKTISQYVWVYCINYSSIVQYLLITYRTAVCCTLVQQIQGIKEDWMMDDTYRYACEMHTAPSSIHLPLFTKFITIHSTQNE